MGILDALAQNFNELFRIKHDVNAAIAAREDYTADRDACRLSCEKYEKLLAKLPAPYADAVRREGEPAPPVDVDHMGSDETVAPTETAPAAPAAAALDDALYSEDYIPDTSGKIFAVLDRRPGELKTEGLLDWLETKVNTTADNRRKAIRDELNIQIRLGKVMRDREGFLSLKKGSHGTRKANVPPVVVQPRVSINQALRIVCQAQPKGFVVSNTWLTQAIRPVATTATKELASSVRRAASVACERGYLNRLAPGRYTYNFPADDE